MLIALVSARVPTPDEEAPRAIVILEEGRIALGFDADLVALDEGLKVAMTSVGGQLAFSWPKGSA
jgi:N-acetylglucosamine-6-phosphate deacetylase